MDTSSSSIIAFKKISTGIPGLDAILLGGMIPKRSYLLVGSPGTGKTIFSLQWLLEGIRQGEKCTYITLLESTNEIKENAKALNWDLDKIDFVDLSPKIDSKKEPSFNQYEVFLPGEVEESNILDTIFKIIKKNKPDRLILDSATQLHYLALDEYQFRKAVSKFIALLNYLGITSLLLFEPTEMEKETAFALATNGVLRLRVSISKNNVIALRSFQVEKLRGTNFLSGFHPMMITDNGIKIFPHKIEKPNLSKPGERKIPFGIVGIDELLKGGIESGTTTIISGPSGVGKSTLASQFLVKGAKLGYKGIFVTFEESNESILFRARSVNMEIDGPYESGALKILRINPAETYPDQLLEIIRDFVEKEEFKLIVIDSLRGYQLAMEEYGTLLSHVHNLVTYLNNNGATTLLINEVEAITGNLMVTELGVSHLADNVILLRYAELHSQVIKLVCCLKKRLGDFQSELRELQITPKGIKVGKPLPNLQGILTGLPNFLENTKSKGRHDK